MGNAFACRSASRPIGQIGWVSNRFLTAAVGCELPALVGFLWIPTVARFIGHAPPPLAALGVAALGAPIVLATDRIHKEIRARRRRQS